MLFSTSLLLFAILVNLISSNDCTTVLSVNVDNAASSVIKGLYDTRQDSNDLKNINVLAILTKPSSCIGLINDAIAIDLFEKGANNGNIANSSYPLFETNNPCESSKLKIKVHNDTHFVTQIGWTIYDRMMIVDNVNVFLSAGDQFGDPFIPKSSLNLACSYRNENRVKIDNGILQFNCYIQTKFIEDLLYEGKGAGIVVSALKFVGRKDALYQVAGITFHESVKRISNYHGYVSVPPSRAKLCQQRVNKKCGLIVYEPQSVEGFKDFPYGTYSPPDGKIASGNNPNFDELNEYGLDRWVRVQFPSVSCHNKTHVSFNISWTFTATHASENINVYISNENYTSSEPLSRRHLDLRPLCTLEFHTRHPSTRLTLFCPISLNKYRQLSEQKESLLLSVWNIYDTPFAFYQVMDLQGLSEEQSYESILQKCR